MMIITGIGVIILKVCDHIVDLNNQFLPSKPNLKHT